MSQLPINKKQIIQLVSESTGINERQTRKVINNFLEQITDHLIAGEKVKLVGFGHFFTRVRGPKVGRNPQSGEEVKIPSRRLIGFRPSKKPKAAVNATFTGETSAD